jgi:hypothetical protein
LLSLHELHQRDTRLLELHPHVIWDVIFQYMDFLLVIGFIYLVSAKTLTFQEF